MDITVIAQSLINELEKKKVENEAISRDIVNQMIGVVSLFEAIKKQVELDAAAQVGTVTEETNG